MWLCLDRLEADLVVLVSDEETIHRLTRDEYIRLVGREPVESDMLWAEITFGRIASATYDETETAIRKAAAGNRLNRLFDKR